jgi:RHS repeat-associated protein
LKSVIQLNHPNPSANTNSYGYDPLGNLIGLTDENTHTTQNLYNLLNEPVQKILPDQTLTETRSYDAAGNLVSLTHFNGVTTTYTYDALNRLLTRSTPGEAPVSFTYSATGKRATMSVGSWNTTYSYDTLDRLTTKAAPAGTLTYSYDGAGNLASMSSNHANGILVAYAWDELNRLSTVVDSRLLGNQTTTYTYDPASNVATVTAPNGLQTTLNYDSLNRLTSLSTPISSYTYTLGATGNRIGAVEGNGRTLSWNYDGIYRLTNETISNDPEKNNGSAAYGLDPVGNRLSLNSSLPGIESGSFGYNADDEILSETYDTNGNVLATNGTTYAYDSENHMTSANNGAVRMIYDGDGNRVAKIMNGVTTQYLVDDLNPTGLPQVVEEVVNDAVTRQYTYGLQRISQNLSPAVTGNNTWTPSFYVYDGGGSVRQLTNSSGVVTDEYEYDAYGHSFTKQGATPNNYFYRDEQYDSDLGLYYLRTRYYNPATGRFLTHDPEDGNPRDPASLHKYLYAGGDPVNIVDPTGRMWDTTTIYFRVLAVVVSVLLVEVAVVEVIDCVAEAIRSISPKSTNTVGGPPKGPCALNHDEWPPGMPPPRLPPPRWPGPGEAVP